MLWFAQLQLLYRCMQPFVGASLLAKVVNDYAASLAPRGALRFFASKLAPTLWPFAALLPVSPRAWLYSLRSAWSAHQESSCSPPFKSLPPLARTSGG
ncbi:hypothetical protein CD175_25110 [Pseudomonas laurylsulfatiphila]|uniref:Uncharacterized protein n=1 Tax=Pseudomonas laurylsulfatiphila TaxID=2011015 RepID=A0A2S6FF42_9PSED|nr:hypothetical protein CD175_25110 [Pseudomonas laurylsulfatiphila]